MPPSPHLDDATLLPWHGDAVWPALVPSACISRSLLLGFVQAMRTQGLPVQGQRMRYDRRYALAVLAQAHGAGDAELRRLAVAMFDVFQPWPPGAPPAAPEIAPAPRPDGSQRGTAGRGVGGGATA